MKNSSMIIGAATATLIALIIGAGFAEPPAARGADMAQKNVPSDHPTYAHDIAPIVNQNCVSCHRTGEVAPFSLTSYEDVKKRAQMIAAVTQSHYMPPWKAKEGAETFVGAHHLTDAQIAVFQTWAAQDAPAGNLADAPPVPRFTSNWSLGEPDAVVQPGKAYDLASDGDDVYRCFVIPTDYAANRYLSAIEVRPGNARVVHHVIAYLDLTGKARDLEAANKDDNPGYTSFGGPGFAPTGALGGWVPGNTPVKQPDGIGTLLPKGADIVLQVHYHKSGKPESDLTKVGLYFTQKPVDQLVRALPIAYPLLNIPPGDADYQVKASAVVPADITVRQVIPHMHWLGHSMTLSAKMPDGRVNPLIDIPDWDFNWQMTYTYQKPFELPKGTRLRLTADYDNSANNPRNPSNPPKRVWWGEQTTDEMCIAFLFYTVDSEHLTQGITGEGIGLERGKERAQIALSMFDTDEDGTLDAKELAALITFFRQRGGAVPATQVESDRQQAVSLKIADGLVKAFDKNGDGVLDADELMDMQELLKGGRKTATKSE